MTDQLLVVAPPILQALSVAVTAVFAVLSRSVNAAVAQIETLSRQHLKL